MTKQPSYRFVGYTEPWGEKKLGEVGDFSIKTNSFSREKLSLNSGEIKNIHYGDILVKYNSTLDFENNSIPYVIDNDTKLTSDMFLKNGDIIFSDAAEDYSVGKCVELFNVSGDIVSGLHTIVCRPQIDFARYFLGYYLNSNSYRQQVFPMVQGAKVSSISKGNLSKTNISFPSLPEQTAIGSFFQDIDQLISLQQRKLEVLKEQKETYIKLLFPAKGQTKPALRFAGFEDDWKEVKLGEVLKKNNKKNRDLAINNVESVSNKLGFVKQTEQFEDYSVASADLSNYYVISEKQFAYNPSRINVGSIAYKKEGDTLSVVSPLYISFSTIENIHDSYLWYWFKTSSFDSQRDIYSEGGVRDTLSFNQLSNIELIFPSLPEQEAIGSFFQDLDKAIAKQEEKVNQLKESKQTLLRKMFI